MILIDAGNWNRNDVVNYLDSQNVSHIDIATQNQITLDN